MNLKKFFAISFLIYFFSNNYIYAETTNVDNPNYLIPMGNVIQIDAELESLMVRNSFENSPFKVGDSLIKINNKHIKNYADFSDLLYTLSNDSVVSVEVKRNNNIINLKVDKNILEKISFNNLISGFATLTYVNPNTSEFGAVAHPINIGETRKISIKNGTISNTTNLTIDKSYRGKVGCINAQKNSTMGKFNTNTDFGIKGKVRKLDLSTRKKYEVANLNEIKTGKASLLMETSNGKLEEFDIYILNIKNQNSPEAKTFRIEVIDEKLINLTGGIVQGMSGTPIIQNGKFVGAVSHAIESTPTLGYGVYIGWMIEGD
ncbi:MAG: SpoIVB peptidase S55 domain-containing protein [Paraclostridium sp.]